jgi:metal-dependent amidase/aminoacylase/carboxypeptidase family protein
MFFLGGSNTEKGTIAMPHSPTFQVDERAIDVGIKAISSLIANYLADPPGTR